MNKSIGTLEYRMLRKVCQVPAQQALRMTNAYEALREAGCEYSYEPEMESAESVFGVACTDKHCHTRNRPCTGVHYDSDVEMVCVVWRDENGGVLTSLGMVEDDGKGGYWSYRWLVAMEMAGEALVELERNAVVV